MNQSVLLYASYPDISSEAWFPQTDQTKSVWYFAQKAATKRESILRTQSAARLLETSVKDTTDRCLFFSSHSLEPSP